MKNYLIELWLRFVTKKPAFFKWIQIIGAVCVGIGYLPQALIYFEITPDQIFSHAIAIVLKVAGATAALIAQLPAPDGQAKALPFSNQKK